MNPSSRRQADEILQAAMALPRCGTAIRRRSNPAVLSKPAYRWLFVSGRVTFFAWRSGCRRGQVSESARHSEHNRRRGFRGPGIASEHRQASRRARRNSVAELALSRSAKRIHCIPGVLRRVVESPPSGCRGHLLCRKSTEYVAALDARHDDAACSPVKHFELPTLVS
jgi:hypothetical protein